MITTLPLIEQALRTGLTGIRPADIFLTGDLNSLPPETMLPALGIKDGPVKHEELAGGMLRTVFQVQLRIWVEVFNERDALVSAASHQGILDLEAALDAVLDENTLGDAAIQSAVKVSPTPESLPVTDGRRDMQAKRLAYEYVKETERPSAARGG